jgi:hypothetical protein
MRLKTPEEQTERRGLFRDRAGATMVMGVFIAALLVGMIYYVWGIGDVIMHRERMQDASDTAAFSAAVMHARGMNMLALINMVMAALAMVSATLAVIANMIKYAAMAASLVCSFCGPWCGSCCSACPYAARHWVEYSRANRISNRVRRFVDGAIRGLNGYARGIRVGVPLAAQAKVVSYGTDVYDPVTDVGAMAPLRAELPAQDDETNWPCDEIVLPPVRIASPVFVWLWASPSPYMLGGIALGELTARSEAREFCNGRSFQRVTDAAQQMGNDEYQVQAYMLGSPDLDWAAEGVSVATWGEGEDAGGTYRRLAEMGRVSFAQAEFFYDDRENDWHEWLWHMNWRARLRRWRLSAAGAGGLMGACGGGSGCGALGELGGSIEDLVVH